MTADIRAAAQREAEELYPMIGADVPAINKSRRLRQKAYTKGYLAGTARVTPTREQIAEVLAEGYQSKYRPADRLPVNHHDLRAADAVLVLMQKLADGNP